MIAFCVEPCPNLPRTLIVKDFVQRITALFVSVVFMHGHSEGEARDRPITAATTSVCIACDSHSSNVANEALKSMQLNDNA